MLSFKSNESEEAKKMLDIKNIWADIWFKISNQISALFLCLNQAAAGSSAERIFFYVCTQKKAPAWAAVGPVQSGIGAPEGRSSELHPGGRVEREKNRVPWCHNSAKKLF